MNKRLLFAILVSMVILLSSTSMVYADVISGNDFIFEHVNKTQRISEHEYIANGPSGYVSAKKRPGADEETIKYENGEVIIISHVYLHKGEYWGTWLYHGVAVDGWVLMDCVLRAYSLYDFNNEYETSFYTYTGSYDAVLSAEKLIIWQWPGSEREKRVVDNPSHYANYHSSYLKEYTYMDNEGREWGYAFLDGWFCISDPENLTNIPAFYPAPEPMKWSPDDMDWSPDGEAAWPLLTIIVVALIAILAVAVFMIHKSMPKSGSAT